MLAQLKKVNFSQNGYDVSFDANGDPVATYELVNWQKSKSGSFEVVTVGHYDASQPVGHEFHINRNLTWVDGSTQVRSNNFTSTKLCSSSAYLYDFCLCIFDRCLCQCALKAVSQELVKCCRKENPYAVMIVYHVLRERLATQQVK